MDRFIKTKAEDNDFDHTNIEVSIIHNEVSLSDLVEDFVAFILACGFSVNPKDFKEEVVDAIKNGQIEEEG